MQYVLGLFVFNTLTAPLTQDSRERNWKHARPAVQGARAAAHYNGPGDDVITLAGSISHDIAGQELSLELLDIMADKGEAYVLIRGTGQIVGAFVIQSIQERRSYLLPNGAPRLIEFTLTLQRVPDDTIDILAVVTAPLSLL